jgi:hypothetical protein
MRGLREETKGTEAEGAKLLGQSDQRGGEAMKGIKELTQEETLEILCAPAHTDEPEESDFADGGETVDGWFIAQYRKELN